MINQNSIAAIDGEGFLGNFVKPLYKSYCFSRIPATIRYVLTGQNRELALPMDVLGEQSDSCDVAILLFLDGFGWRFFEHYLEKSSFLQHFVREGTSNKLTAQFPSTTAAHATCIHTGQEVGESGVYEWFYYEPKVDRVIAPLLSSFAGDKKIGTLEVAGVEVAALYPQKTLYQQFKEEGIHSYILQPINIAHSLYSQAMSRGALYQPYHHLGEALDYAVELVKTAPLGEKRYICLYFGEIDAVGHRHGLFSEEYDQTVIQALARLEERLYKKLQGVEKKIAVMVTADHGMIEIDPAKTFYINRELPEIIPYLKKNREGKPIAPAGSCRDFFLHVEESHLREVEMCLKEALGKTTWIVKTSELIQKQFFGSHAPSKDFLSRVGNLVILPHGHESIWWYEKDRFEENFFAMHGGLTREEMETIFLFSSPR
ncbi:MAG: alkaline phosphatase family protein [Simkania sp.]|nr:alkaline phosphatase family protein [Simkania sp.]